MLFCETEKCLKNEMILHHIETNLVPIISDAILPNWEVF